MNLPASHSDVPLGMQLLEYANVSGNEAPTGKNIGEVDAALRRRLGAAAGHLGTAVTLRRWLGTDDHSPFLFDLKLAEL